MEQKVTPCTVAIAGLGSRGLDTYAQCVKRFPEKMQIAAVADLRPERVALAVEQLGLKPEQCYDSVEQMLQQDRLADILFVCTQDRQHVGHAIAAMRKGYHVLMEKPVSPELEECREVLKVAQETGRQVIVCHVLRYTPFYNQLKEILDSGIIGDIACVQHVENVRFYHHAHSYVRGNWRRSDETSPMIMAKCCHDLDILLWLTGKHCKAVSSYGSTFHFRKEKAPAGAAERCLDGCECKESCPYDAEKIYITNPGTGVANGRTGWPCNVLHPHPTEENIRHLLKTGPYGRCVYACDNDVVDHQVVNMLMEDGASFQMTMSAFTAYGGRYTKIMGTLGEINADLHKNTITVMPYGGQEYVIDIRKIAKDLGGHAGGDSRMVEEFLDVVSGRIQPTVRHTSLENSMESHFIALAAELSRVDGGRSVEIAEVADA